MTSIHKGTRNPRTCEGAPEYRKRVWTGPERSRYRDWIILRPDEQQAVDSVLESLHNEQQIEMELTPQTQTFLRRHHGWE